MLGRVFWPTTQSGTASSAAYSEQGGVERWHTCSTKHMARFFHVDQFSTTTRRKNYESLHRARYKHPARTALVRSNPAYFLTLAYLQRSESSTPPQRAGLCIRLCRRSARADCPKRPGVRRTFALPGIPTSRSQILPTLLGLPTNSCL